MIRFEIVGGSDCPQFGTLSHAVLIRGGALQDADPLPVFSLAQMKRSIEEGKTWADMVGRSEHFFLLVPNWCVEEITSKFGDYLRLCPEVASVPDKDQSVVEELVKVLQQPHIAEDLERHPHSDVEIKMQDGKPVLVTVSGKHKPLPAA